MKNIITMLTISILLASCGATNTDEMQNDVNGIAWCFGKHDRAWAERLIFGKIRYMNAAGLKRKFDIDKYVSKIDILTKNK